MNINYCGNNLVDSGVDINRNYGYHFEFNQENSD